MKTTTRLIDIFESEARKRCFNGFVDKTTGELIAPNSELAINFQIPMYTDLVKTITDEALFAHFEFSSKAADVFFKRMFINHFMNREIKYQTLDAFRQKLVSLSVNNDQYISAVYDNFMKLFSNDTTNNSKSNQNNTQEHRNAHVDLPQDNTGLDLNNDIVDYASTTDMDKLRNNADTTTTSDTVSFSPDVLAKLTDVYTKKLDEYDKYLFLHMW